MKIFHYTYIVLFAIAGLTACNKNAAPSTKSSDPVLQKLQEYSGSGATDCGRLDVKAAEAQSKATSDCALHASQGKHPFYVAYDMPGMTVGVAGNAAGRLFTVESQGTGPSGTLTAGDCPSQLRVATSGRVTCFAPGDMGSMGAGHSGAMMPSGMENPHSSDEKSPGHP